MQVSWRLSWLLQLVTSHPLGKINVVSYLPDIFKPMREFLFSLRRTTLIVARNVCLIWLQMEQSALAETIEIRPHGVFKGSEGEVIFFRAIFCWLKVPLAWMRTRLSVVWRALKITSLVTRFEGSRKALSSFETSPEAPNFWLRAIQQKSLLEGCTSFSLNTSTKGFFLLKRLISFDIFGQLSHRLFPSPLVSLCFD